MTLQPSLFDGGVIPVPEPFDLRAARSGTFVDNMALPVHRWFRYSAGFAAEWVRQVLDAWGIRAGHVVLDPFAGSGTVSVVCDGLNVRSIGVEAHPVVARISRAKLNWGTSVDRFALVSDKIFASATAHKGQADRYPPLIQRSFEEDTLATLDSLRVAWHELDDGSPESELVWLAITAILRPTSTAGTAQWQYILPNKTKRKVLPPRFAFREQVEMMKADMRWMQSRTDRSRGRVITGDARSLGDLIDEAVDAVITSPPYANNYDYADALRFEMTFWGEVTTWGDIHDKVRKGLIVSSSQHSSRERLVLDDLLSTEEVAPIRAELAEVTSRLAEVREGHGGKKHYHTMIAAYCRDIARVLRQLRRVCAPRAHMCWVIGDSAPYGVYAPIEEWIGKLALEAGFVHYRFEKLRDRNVKWRNRKHRVPLKEGLLWIEG
jgi:hypothetical protein